MTPLTLASYQMESVIKTYRLNSRVYVEYSTIYSRFLCDQKTLIRPITHGEAVESTRLRSTFKLMLSLTCLLTNTYEQSVTLSRLGTNMSRESEDLPLY